MRRFRRPPCLTLDECQQIVIDLPVVHYAHPWGNPGYTFKVEFLTSFAVSIAEAPIGTI